MTSMTDPPSREETGRARAPSGDSFQASKRRVAERNEQASKAALQRRRAFEALRAKLRSGSEQR
jgi:hypothetical protein